MPQNISNPAKSIKTLSNPRKPNSNPAESAQSLPISTQIQQKRTNPANIHSNQNATKPALNPGEANLDNSIRICTNAQIHPSPAKS